MIDNQYYINHVPQSSRSSESDNEDIIMNGHSHFAEIMAYSLDISKLIHQPPTSLSYPARKLKVMASRTKMPPDSYICRLCKVPGHWIDECIHYKPRGKSFSTNSRACLLCNESGHQLEQCTNYTAQSSLNHAAKSFSTSNSPEYFYTTEEFLNF